MKKLVSLCTLNSLPDRRAQLVKGPDGRRYACVRRGSRVDLLDDRCPHEGHPLSMGLVRDGVLTCQWHNWKFSLDDGACLRGGEHVARYDAEVHDGEVFFDPRLDDDDRRARIRHDLERALERAQADGATREALRLLPFEGGLDEAVDAMVRHAMDRDGCAIAGHARAALSLRDAGVLDDADALAVLASAAVREGGLRAVAPSPVAPSPATRAATLDDGEAVLLALLDERVDEAESYARGVPPSHAMRALDAWLMPWAALKLWNGGATLAALADTRAVAAHLTDGTRTASLAALTRGLGVAVAESDLPPWRHTRKALLEARVIQPGTAALDDAEALARDALTSEGQGLHATLIALDAGASPAAVLTVLARTAAERAATWNVAHSRDDHRDVRALDATRALRFCRAAQTLAGAVPGTHSVAHAVLAAGLVGKLRRHTHVAETPARAHGADTLADALARRDGAALRALVNGGASLAALTGAAALDGDGSHAPFAADCHAMVRDGTLTVSAARDAMVRAVFEEPPASLARLAARAKRAVERTR